MTLQRFNHVLRKTKWNTRTAIHRTLSTNTQSSTNEKNVDYRTQILSASLPHVHSHGWTSEAIAQGVLSTNLPPSYIGKVPSGESDLIHYFMRDCNTRFNVHLQQLDVSVQPETKSKGNDNSRIAATEAAFVEYAIRKRLEMVGPYIQSQRWAEGMALGASPFQVQQTTKYLEEIVSIIETHLSRQFEDSAISFLDRGGIGTIYVATELHLLADSSSNYQDTWMFLNQRVMDLQMIKSSTGTTQSGVPTADSLVAAQAVASSLGGAVLSLMAPAARASVSTIAGAVVPKVMDLMQKQSSSSGNAHRTQSTTTSTSSGGGRRGTHIDDYELPSFEGEKAIEFNGK